MKKISIVIPVYNSEKYLNKCLDSILRQTMQDYEVIIVNDGSDDNSQSIICEYASRYPGLFSFTNVENGGQGRARNLGIHMTSGEYIVFIDSDDYIAPEMLEVLYHRAKEKNADMVVCNYIIVHENGDKEEVISKKFMSQKDMFIDPDVSPCNKIYRGEILRNSEVHFPEKVFYEDTAFYLKLLPDLGTITSVDDFLYYYVIHGNSSTHGEQDCRVKHIFYVMDDVLKYYVNTNNFYKFYYELEYAYVKILLCSSMGRICRVKDKHFRKKMQKETLYKVNSRFPDYRKNPYLKHGLKAFYMKHAALWNISGCTFLMRNLKIHQI